MYSSVKLGYRVYQMVYRVYHIWLLERACAVRFSLPQQQPQYGRTFGHTAIGLMAIISVESAWCEHATVGPFSSQGDLVPAWIPGIRLRQGISRFAESLTLKNNLFAVMLAWRRTRTQYLGKLEWKTSFQRGKYNRSYPVRTWWQWSRNLRSRRLTMTLGMHNTKKSAWRTVFGCRPHWHVVYNTWLRYLWDHFYENVLLVCLLGLLISRWVVAHSTPRNKAFSTYLDHNVIHA